MSDFHRLFVKNVKQGKFGKKSKLTKTLQKSKMGIDDRKPLI